MTTTEKRVDFLQCRIARFLLEAGLGGINLLCFYFYRSAEEQNRLYKEGKSNCDGYKKRSKHQSWLAMDFVIIDDAGKPIWNHTARYELLGEIWERLGGKWGGRFKSPDVFHFEYGG
jgi:hypothetical protein